jgi:hypothetical protein
MPKVVFAYLTINHDAKAFLSAMGEEFGDDTAVIGCSTQGVMGREFFAEDGYIAGLMGIGGDGVDVAVATVDDIPVDTHEKGRGLGIALRDQVGPSPKLAYILYDPLCGADADQLVNGMYEELPCTVVGGGASHAWGPLASTYQYEGERVFNAGAGAVALDGDFQVETAISSGCSPVGIEMMVTAADENRILELDGDRALDVWRDIAGSFSYATGDQSAALAIGVPVVTGGELDGYLVRAAYGFTDDGGAVLQTGVPAGTAVMLQHRTIEDALNGSKAMATELAERVAARSIVAVLGLECGGRTKPFLGIDVCRRENAELQRILGPEGAWLGFLPWAEIHPIGGEPRFNNFTYPMVVITA